MKELIGNEIPRPPWKGIVRCLEDECNSVFELEIEDIFHYTWKHTDYSGDTETHSDYRWECPKCNTKCSYNTSSEGFNNEPLPKNCWFRKVKN